jgi:hypothetical protein
MRQINVTLDIGFGWREKGWTDLPRIETRVQMRENAQSHIH